MVMINLFRSEWETVDWAKPKGVGAATGDTLVLVRGGSGRRKQDAAPMRDSQAALAPVVRGNGFCFIDFLFRWGFGICPRKGAGLTPSPVLPFVTPFSGLTE